MRKLISASCCGVAMLAVLWVLPAAAVTTSHWVQGNEADFAAGKMHNVVVSNLGDVKLSRAIETIKEEDANVTSVNCLAEAPDGTIYAGTGPKGELLAIKDGKVTTAATIDGAVSVLSLLVDSKGGLLVGTGGDKGLVYRIDKPGDKPRQIFADDSVQYVWAMVQTPDGKVYAGTGPTAQLWEIAADGTHKSIYSSGEDNISSLISDGKDLLYLGTDPNGMVVRINRKTAESFILYNAGETEVTALALDDKGNLYAATGEAGERQPTPPEGPKDKTGRPDGEGAAPSIPAAPPATPPKTPEPPAPNPGEPRPIPHAGADPYAHPIMMDVIVAKPEKKPAAGPAEKPTTEPSDEGPNSPPDNGPIPPGSHQVVPGEGPGAEGFEGAEGPKPEGNAVYRIDPDGFVTEVFRQNVVIYGMIAQGATLLVGTGDDGNIYQIDPAAEEITVLAKVDAKEVMCLLPVKGGKIIAGLANAGGIVAMTSGFASDGTYTSPVMDATQVSRLGKIQLHGTLPEGTTLKVSTRSGNVKDADAAGWSKWTGEVPASQFVKVTAPSARFLQYRLTFASSDATKTAVVDHVDVSYQMPNMAPVIKSVKIGSGDDSGGSSSPSSPPGSPSAGPVVMHGAPPHGGGGGGEEPKPQGTGTQTITWDASDPNSDTLIYSLYFRLENHGPWILLKDKLKEPTFDWDTKSVADGEYQIKVVASDAPSNPAGTEKTASRVSDYYVVVNTPPVIGDLVWKADGKNIKIDARINVRTGTVASAEYTVDSNDDWQALLPVDNIFDSPDEKVSFTVQGLSAGPHQLTIRATDSHGNQALQTVQIKVD